MPLTRLDELCINTIRTLAMDMVQRANSGHPGTAMGLATAAYVLWTRHLRYNPRDPKWPGRDRFILSAGHASPLLYSLLYLTGYDVTLDDLKNFRQWGSITPGHPESAHTPGVEVTTGPLGQGFANGVGMAIAERYLAAMFNRPGHAVIDHRIYAICSDGDLMEGVASEAASLAGHLRLGKLIYLYDDNKISIDGSTDLTFTEDVGRRFEAYGWHVQRIDGMDPDAVDAALTAARGETSRPSIIIARTHIGFGSPRYQDTAFAHGNPLGEDEVRATKERLGWPPDAHFYVPGEALARWREAIARGRALQDEWERRFAAYEETYPDAAARLRMALKGQLPEGWDADLPSFPPEKPMATRAASGKALDALAGRIPWLLAGGADLTENTHTKIAGALDHSAAHPEGRVLRFGVREHAMGAIANGICAHGGVIPAVGTFMVFSDYLRPALRLASMSRLGPIFVFTHDSVGLGEDGPTHQPIEHLPSLRAIPGLVLIRPCDANETSVAWRVAIERRDGPTVLALTRQAVPVLDRSRLAPATELVRGAYVLSDAEGARPDVILIGTGSEVAIALDAQALLRAEGIDARVVSMPSWELFEAQPRAYRDEVLPPAVTARVAVEAASPFGWERWVGAEGRVVGIAGRFGASAPYKVIYEKLGLTPANVAQQARELVRGAARAQP
jgi:transketolase